MARYTRNLIKTDQTNSTCIESKSNDVKFKDAQYTENLKIGMRPKEVVVKTSFGKDLKFVNGIEVEVARACGRGPSPSSTNVQNCFSFKRPRIIIGSTESNTAVLEITFSGVPDGALSRQLVITANGVTSTITFTNSGSTATTFSANAANVRTDSGHKDTVAKVAAAVTVLYNSLSNYSAAVDGSNTAKLRMYADVAYTSTYDIVLNTNTTGASTAITAGKHFMLYPGDSGALVVFDTDNATVLLPDSEPIENLGCSYTFVNRSLLAASATPSGQKILCADTTNEKIYGAITAIVSTIGGYTLGVYTAASGNNYSAIKWNGTTTGGANSHITLTAIAADQWVATDGVIYQTGTPATPFLTS